MILRSAGILSPPFTSTRSPTTTSSALMCFFSPSRTTRACYKNGHSSCLKTGKNNSLVITNWTCKEHLRDQVLEGVHDLGALGFLIVREAAGDDDDSREHNTQVQLWAAKTWWWQLQIERKCLSIHFAREALHYHWQAHPPLQPGFHKPGNKGWHQSTEAWRNRQTSEGKQTFML